MPSTNYPQGDYDWSTPPTATEFAIGTRYRFADPEVLAANGAGGMGTALSDAIKAALAANQPVAIEFPVRPGFDNLSPSNPLDTDTTGPIRGYHEVVALGYDANGLLIENQCVLERDRAGSQRRFARGRGGDRRAGARRRRADLA